MVRKKTKADRSEGDDGKRCKATSNGSSVHGNGFHNFGKEEQVKMRSNLLAWYDDSKRDLPWRNIKTEDINQRAYAVWVSEIMLQQTQVATVIDYYNRWMKKWPTLQKLSKASLEEVNEMWSGLGYYSRGKRLHEGAQKVVAEFGGEMPKTAAELLKHLPGVGRYTAGAIASIAYNQVTPLVDGNVVRVFSRLRRIGSDSTSQTVMDSLWSLAEKLVDPDRPGDFNQSLMELGATVCTPKSPLCSECPVRNQCRAYAQVEKQKHSSAIKLGVKTEKKPSEEDLIDIECVSDDCKLCLPPTESYDDSLGVMNYPRKPKKKAPREDKTVVFIVQCESSKSETKYLIMQRPDTGLLAGLWEFLCVPVDVPSAEKLNQSNIQNLLETNFGVSSDSGCDFIGEVIHIFSHIHQTYIVYNVHISDKNQVSPETKQNIKWVTKTEFLESAISTAMRKVFKAYETSQKGTIKDNKL